MKLSTTFFFLEVCFVSSTFALASTWPTTLQTSTSPSSSAATGLWSSLPYTSSSQWPWTTTTTSGWTVSTPSQPSESLTSVATSSTSACSTFSSSAPSTWSSDSCPSATSTGASASATSSAEPSFIEEYVCQGNCTAPEVVAVIECLFFMLTYDPEDWVYCFSNVVGAAPSVSASATSTLQATPSPAPAKCKKQGQPPAPAVDRSVVEKVVDGVGDLVVAGVDLVCVLGKGIGKLFTCTVDAATRHPNCVKK